MITSTDNFIATYGLPIASVFGLQTVNYVFCQLVKDNSHIDTTWSLTFILPNVIILANKLLHAPTDDSTTPPVIDVRTWIINAALLVWGLRLALHIGMRHKGEDYRYVEMRESWSARGQCWYYVCAFFIIFMLQAALSLIVNAPVLYVTAYSSTPSNVLAQTLVWSDYAGYLIFSIGLFFEWVGDAQLKAHIADRDEDKGKFCKRGLWRYTRHPNYFGDALLWWGFYFMALAVPGGYWTFFGPLTMTVLLRYVSGVAMLETKQRKHPEFARYAAETNAFIPWPYKKVDVDDLQEGLLG